MDSFTVLPLQIYNWTGRPQHEFQELAAGGIIVLLCILFVSHSKQKLIPDFTYRSLQTFEELPWNKHQLFLRNQRLCLHQPKLPPQAYRQ